MGAVWVPYPPDGDVVVWMNARFLERITDVEMAACFEREPTLDGTGDEGDRPISMSTYDLGGWLRADHRYPRGPDSITPITSSIDNQPEHATIRLGKGTFELY